MVFEDQTNLKCYLKICHSIDAKGLIFCAQYFIENVSSIEGENDFKNYISSKQDLCA